MSQASNRRKDQASKPNGQPLTASQARVKLEAVRMELLWCRQGSERREAIANLLAALQTLIVPRPNESGFKDGLDLSESVENQLNATLIATMREAEMMANAEIQSMIRVTG